MSNKSHHLFEGLAHHSIKTTGKLLDDKDGSKSTAVIEFFLITFALFTFVGAVAAKVFFRKNPQLNGLDTFLFILSFLGFCGAGLYAFSMVNRPDSFGSSDSYLVFGILYIILAFTLLVKGIKCLRSKSNRNYSSIITSLAKEGWSQNKIHNLGEPLLILIIGLMCSVLNILAGIPLIFCAISVWVHLLKDKIMGKKAYLENVISINKEIHKPDEFNEVN